LILVFRDGEIVEQGNHRDLMRKGGLYAELAARQLRVGEAEGEASV
jgi:ABC-type multidrug transport system fused ATPase/permease subunit